MDDRRSLETRVPSKGGLYLLYAFSWMDFNTEILNVLNKANHSGDVLIMWLVESNTWQHMLITILIIKTSSWIKLTNVNIIRQILWWVYGMQFTYRILTLRAHLAPMVFYEAMLRHRKKYSVGLKNKVMACFFGYIINIIVISLPSSIDARGEYLHNA